jgi:hypothetical protein
MIIPHRHDKNHTFLQGGPHGSETSLGFKLVLVTKGSLLRVTEGVGEGVTCNPVDGGRGVGDDNTIWT